MSAPGSRACPIRATSGAKETDHLRIAAASRASANCWKPSPTQTTQTMPTRRNGPTTIPTRSTNCQSNMPSPASQTAATPLAHATPRKSPSVRPPDPRGLHRIVTERMSADHLLQSSSASRFTAGVAHGLLPKAASSARFAFWRQLTSRLRYNHASIAKVSLLLTSTTCAVVATRADTCRTSNSIMSSLSAIFIAPVTSISFFMALLLLHYGILVAYIWMRAILRVFTCGRDDFSDGGRKHGERSPAVEGGTRTISRHAAACEGRRVSLQVSLQADQRCR